MQRVNNRYVWDKREGHYFIEWWEGKRRCRELARQTPSQATEAQRRKRNELIGEMAIGGKQRPNPVQVDEEFTRIPDAVGFFASHIHTHSPAKPRTLERYKEVLSHFERLLGKKKYVEAITRLDIDDYKIARSKESAGKGKVTGCVAASTINFEVTVLRSFFYYLIRERGIKAENPCAHFKALRSAKERLKSKPQTYTQDEINRLLAACNPASHAMYATLLLTGLRRGARSPNLGRCRFPPWGNPRPGKSRLHTQRLRGARYSHAARPNTTSQESTEISGMGISSYERESLWP